MGTDGRDATCHVLHYPQLEQILKSHYNIEMDISSGFWSATEYCLLTMQLEFNKKAMNHSRSHCTPLMLFEMFKESQ